MKVIFSLIIFHYLFTSCALVKDVAFPPEDYGNPDVFKNITPKIMLFPFSVISNIDGHWENTSYHSSKEIGLWIYFRIKENCNIVFPDTSNNFYNDTLSTAYNVMVEFKNELIKTILANPDSVRFWNSSVKNNSYDSTSYFYFPLCIEKENNHSVSGSFYTVIANYKGRIIFIRKIDYNPIKWSEDYRYFRDDTRNKMPLAKWGV